MILPLRNDQIDTLVDYFQDWIDKRIISMDNPSLEDAMNEIYAKEVLKAFLIELFGETK